MFQFLVTDPKHNSKKYSFDQASVTIGRAEGNDLVIACDDVSRFHCRVDLIDNKAVIQDLGSTNGIFVNGQRVTKSVIWPHDKLQIGEFFVAIAIEEKAEEDVVEKPIEVRHEGFLTRKPTEIHPTEEEPEEVEETSSFVMGEEQEETKEEVITETSDEGHDALYRILAPVWTYVRDGNVTAIMLNGPGRVFIQSRGVLTKTEVMISETEMSAIAAQLARLSGKTLSISKPSLCFKASEEIEVSVVIPPLARTTTIVITKSSSFKPSLEEMVEQGALSPEMVTFLHGCLALSKNIIISGGRSSGVTTTASTLAGLMPFRDRIVTVETKPELELAQEHVVSLSRSAAPDSVIEAALSLNPSRLVISDLETVEAGPLLQAMARGQNGVLATLRAASTKQALERLETFLMLSGFEATQRVMKETVVSAVDVVVQTALFADGSRKVVNIALVLGIAKDGGYQLRDVYRFQTKGIKGRVVEGAHIWTGYVPSFVDEFESSGLNDAVSLFVEDAD